MTGKNKPPLSEETLINKLPFSVIKSLSLRLDIERQWERLVTKIPKRLSDAGNADCESRYSHLQVRLFEEKSKRPDGSPTGSILNDWATQNARVKHLLLVLQAAYLYEAADYLSESVLHQGKVPRIPVGQSDDCNLLPHPAWNDGKKIQNDTHKIPSSNFNAASEKEFYNKDMSYNASMQCNNLRSMQEPESTYDGLLKQSSKENEYKCLSPTAERGGGVVYNRAPSYTSGEGRSMLLQGGNFMPPQDQLTPTEHEESHCIYEKAKATEELYSYANNEGNPVPLREPCESSDEPKENANKTDIYKHIGPQRSLSYSILKDITDGFDRRLLAKGGRIIGTGGFGEVFLGVFKDGHKVAVKKLKNVDESDRQFETELQSLTKYRHKNIVCLYAYSVDGPGKCLVYEYLQNGSLEDRLMRKDQTPPLTVDTRLKILQGTAEGIAYLNNQGKVHRDIKSANVLLDEDFLPKVGDFATARTAPKGNATMPISTQVVIGTSAYLAPEATTFDISTKLDAYSYGVIILEVLTALPPIDPGREEKDLKSHVEESEIHEILDTSGGEWNPKLVNILAELSEKCTQRKKKFRCNVADILEELLALHC